VFYPAAARHLHQNSRFGVFPPDKFVSVMELRVARPGAAGQ
jgi:hypothetical protein